jgi:hypothetical protein
MARRRFKDFVKGATPAGKFVFPNLRAPNKRFEKEFGEYTVNLDLAGEAAESLKKQIDEALAAEYKHECAEKGEELPKYHGRPYRQATEGKEKTPIEGVTRFAFKRKAGGRYGPNHPKAGEIWTTTVPIFGARGSTKVIDDVWGGTTGRISYVIVPWFTNSLGFGVRLQLEAVQVIDLVTQGERAPDEYGFDEEDGYVPPTSEAKTETDDASLDEGEGGVEF